MPYPVQLFWAIELALQSRLAIAGMPLPYTEFADRWGNAGFTEYVKLLEQQADQALQTGSETIQYQQKNPF